MKKSIQIGALTLFMSFAGVSGALASEADVAEQENTSKISEYVTFTGVIEGEFSAGKDYDKNNFSEFNVATVDLVFDVQITDLAAGHILIEFEGEEEDLFVDEVFIELGNTEESPAVLTFGKYCMGFGKFETNMIQDPMTLEIGEICDYGITIGSELGGFYGAAFVYNGLKETGEDDTISGLGMMAGYSYEGEGVTLDAGVSLVNNIADAGAITDFLDSKGLDTVDSHVGGLSVNVLVEFGSIAFIGEYSTALDNFDPLEISFKGEGAEPKAWNVEAAYSTEIMGKETVFALGYQQTDEAVELELPEKRLIGAVSLGVMDATTLTFEYFNDEDYSETDGGSGEDGQTFTLQLAYEF